MELKEYRLERLKNACAAAGADMIVATLPANLNYITTGYVCVNQDVLTRAECAIGYIPAKDKLVYIVGYAELPTVFEFAGLDAEIYCYSGAFCFENGAAGDPFVEKIMGLQKDAYPSSADAWNAAVRANLPEGSTVAIDESRIFASVLKKVEEKLAGYKTVNATDIFMQARLVKHPDEVAGIEASALCAGECLTAALAQFKPGMTENDIGTLYNIELAKRGAKPYFCTVTSALRSAFSDTTNDSSRPIVEGDMIRFDFGCILNGYCSDLGRIAVVGKPSEKIVSYYKAIVAGLDAAVAIAKPGVTPGELFDVAMETVRKEGIPHYRRHHIGHGIGVECYDLPSVSHGVDLPIVENMTFNLETPY